MINVRLAGSRNRLFFTVFIFFFSVGEELTLLSLHGKIQSTHGDFSLETSDRFHRFSLSDIILLVHSDLLWVEYRWKRPVYYLFYPSQGLHDVFGVEMLRTYVLVAVDRNSLSARWQKVLHFFRSFFLLGRQKKLRYGRVLGLFFTRKWHNTSNLSVLLSK